MLRTNMVVIKRVVLIGAFFVNSLCKCTEDTVHNTLSCSVVYGQGEAGDESNNSFLSADP